MVDVLRNDVCADWNGRSSVRLDDEHDEGLVFACVGGWRDNEPCVLRHMGAT